MNTVPSKTQKANIGKCYKKLITKRDEKGLEYLRLLLASNEYKGTKDMALIQKTFIAILQNSPIISKDELLELIDFMFHKISVGVTKRAYEFLTVAVRDMQNLLSEIKTTQLTYFASYIKIREAITDWSHNIEMILINLEIELRSMTIDPEDSWIQDALGYIHCLSNIDDRVQFLRGNPVHLDHVVNIITRVNAESPQITMNEQPQEQSLQEDLIRGKP